MTDKTKPKTLHDILPHWRSLGIAFDRRSSISADIEKTLIETLPWLSDDLKILQLCLSWLNQMADLVHVERLDALSHELPPIELAFLGGIAEFTKVKYRGWNLIVRSSMKRLRPHFAKGFTPNLPEKVRLAITHGVSKTDPAFAKFKLMIPTIQLAASKKLIPRQYVIEDHAWLGLRALMGSNWRADVAYCMLCNKSINAYQISKRLDCSYETAYRLKNSLDESPLHTCGLKNMTS